VTMTLPFTFEFLNGDRNTADAVIYRKRDNDQRANTLILRLTAHSQFPMPGGPTMPPDNGPAADGPAALYLSFGDIYDNLPGADAVSTKGGEWQTLANSGWQEKLIAGQKRLCLSRTSLMQLQPRDTVEFKFKPVFYAGNNPEVTIDYYNLQDHGPHKTRIEVRVLDRPEYRTSPPLQAWTSGAGNISPAQVFISPREYPLTNRLTIHLLNEGKTPLVPQPASNPNNPPSFRLSFRAGNASDRNALTTEDKVKAIKVQESGGWAASLEGNLIPSTWLLRPDKSEVLAGGEEVQVVFDHVEIPSEFSTGGASVWLEYRNLPGYNDGFKALSVQRAKAAPSAAIDGFALKKPTVPRYEPVYLTWKSSAVPFLGLRYRRHDNNEITYYPKTNDDRVLPLQTGPDGFEVPFDAGDGGTFSLEGFPDKPALLNREEAMGLVKRLQFAVTRPIHDLVPGEYQGKRTYGRPDGMQGSTFDLAIEVSIASDKTTGSFKVKTDFPPSERNQSQQTLFQGRMELNPEKTDLELSITRSDTQRIATIGGWGDISLICRPGKVRLSIAADGLVLDWSKSGEWFTVHLPGQKGLGLSEPWKGAGETTTLSLKT
jgi:hypothetical protein